MTGGDEMLELFAGRGAAGGGNVIEYPGSRDNSGVLSYQGVKTMIRERQIVCLQGGGILPEQIQPASLDLRLGPRAYRVRASFLPGAKATVREKIEQLDGLPAIDLTNDAVFEKGAVYVVELLESLQLTNGLVGIANPKSSTGRLDVLTRLITDYATAFDRVEPRYTGPLYIEVAPVAFSIVVRQGIRLNQLRFYRGAPSVAASELERLYKGGHLIKPCGPLLPLRGAHVPVTVDLEGSASAGIVGYRAKKNTNKIDLELVAHYDPREFWERVEPTNGRLNLDQGDFYILATCEEVGVPPHLAAEMVAYDSASGEFRAHYAGFFDPGFGYVDGKAQGSRAVLEVRSHGVSFTLEHGQIVGWLNYSRLAGGPPDRLYGAEIKSNYQGQKVALAKQFKPWPR